jgi:hypothetical protein
VVEHDDFMTEEHEVVDQMTADEDCATCDEDALTARLVEKLDRRKMTGGRVEDGLQLRVVDRL